MSKILLLDLYDDNGKWVHSAIQILLMWDVVNSAAEMITLEKQELKLNVERFS